MKFPKRLWAATAPFGTNTTRSLALCVGGVITYRAGNSAASRIGLYAMISSIVTEAMETYEEVAWIAGEVTTLITSVR